MSDTDLETTAKKTVETPYPPPDGATPREMGPEDKKPGAGVPAQEILAEFLQKVQSSPTPETTNTHSDFAVPEGHEELSEKDKETIFTNATLEKVAAFLDPNTRGPVTMIVARHKVFVMHVATQQELLDVESVTGLRIGEVETNAQATWRIIAQLKKSCYGYLPQESPEAQVLRANIAWPKLWPPLRPPTWTDTRDPYLISEEIIPLYGLFQKWQDSVVPTKAEFDFYFASQR